MYTILNLISVLRILVFTLLFPVFKFKQNADFTDFSHSRINTCFDNLKERVFISLGCIQMEYCGDKNNSS